MAINVGYNAWIFFTNLGTISFSRRTLLNGVSNLASQLTQLVS